MMTERERLEAALRSLKLQVGVLNPIEGHSVRVYPVRLGRVKGDNLMAQLPEVAGRMGVKQVRGAFIAGSSRFGIEVPRHDPQPLHYRDVYPLRSKARLPIVLGKDVYAKLQVIDLAAAPHLLIGGGTGSGKSTAINGFICGLMSRLSPLLLRFILIDPKKVELATFANAPHAIQGSISEPQRAVSMLEALGRHMDTRYSLLEQASCRELNSYNQWAKAQQQPLLPRIVVVVDELADLMLTSKGRCEKALVRLAQKARAVGIHLILATQQPKSEVVTSLIKVNIPARLAFAVGNHHESRAILDASGAENLLGKGDALFVDRQHGALRVQSPFISDKDMQQSMQQLQHTPLSLKFLQKVSRQPSSDAHDSFLQRFPELADGEQRVQPVANIQHVTQPAVNQKVHQAVQHVTQPAAHQRVHQGVKPRLDKGSHKVSPVNQAQPVHQAVNDSVAKPAMPSLPQSAKASAPISVQVLGQQASTGKEAAPAAIYQQGVQQTVIHNPDAQVNAAIALAKARGKLTGVMLIEEAICSRSESKKLMNRLRELHIIDKHSRKLGYSPLIHS